MDVARELRGAGYSGFVIKDHHLPTPALAQLVNEACGGGFTAFGGIALNSAVGGINLHAVDAAGGMGARMVYLPTISAVRHLEIQGDLFAGSSASAVEERAVRITDDKGAITQELEAVLQYIAKHPGIVLATGHSSANELDLVIRRAVELGIERVFINHPAHTIGATWEQMEAWSRLDGAYLEVNALDIIGMSNSGRFPMSLMEEYFRRIPTRKTVVTSDFGQPKNASPVEGMLRFIGAIRGFGVSDDEIVKMIKDTPSYLLS
jgi:hypothetical protein